MVKKRGTLLYLPQLFHHATENNGETIGVGWQINLESEVVSGTVKHILQTRPNNPLALFQNWIQDYNHT